jgi:tyrosine-specific transport protein
MGFREFIGIIGFVGAVLGVIDGVAILLMFKKAKKLSDREPEYSLKVPSLLIYLLMLIFIFGAVVQIFFV